MLAVIETHPIQYHAPVYMILSQQFGLPVHTIYGSDFSVAGGLDHEFSRRISWDVDLLQGYHSYFLSRVADGGATSIAEVRSRGLSQLLRRMRPTAILIVGYSPFFHQMAILAALSLGRPILFRGETNDDAGHRNRFKAAIRRQGLQLLYRQFSAFLYVGKRSREHYEHLGCPAERLFFSPYGVDTRPHEKFIQNGDGGSREDLRQLFSIPREKVVIVFSGKLYPAKGPGVLLQAIRALPEEYRTRVQLLIVGDGEMRGQLEQLALQEPTVSTLFVGFQNQTTLGQFYRMADLVVLPSFSETWGLVVNEALLYGVPCVVTDRVGCGPDLVQPGITGEICQARSVSSLAEALRRAFRLIGDDRVAENCRRLVARYSLEAAARGIFEAYQYVTKN